MNRINPHDVPAMFERLGLSPVNGDWVSGDNCACLLVALLADTVGKEAAMCRGTRWSDPEKFVRIGSVASFVARETTYTQSYLLGLVWGFDDPPDALSEHISPHSSAEYVAMFSAGWQDGQAARVLLGLPVSKVRETEEIWNE